MINTENSPTETAAVKLEPSLSIGFEGNSVQLMMKPDMTVWQALGLIESAKTILLARCTAAPSVTAEV